MSRKAAIGTVLIQNLDDLPHALDQDATSDVATVILVSHSFTLEVLTPHVTHLPCAVFLIKSFGVMGHDSKGKLEELEIQGFGREWGGAGVPIGKAGVLVLTLRKQSEIIVGTRLSEVPTLEKGALGNIVFANHSHQASAIELVESSLHAVSTGGFCAGVFKLVAGVWKEIDFITVTFMASPRTAFNVCITSLIDGKPACQSTAAKELMSTIPVGFRPEFVAIIGCCMGGQQFWKSRNVETSAAETLVGGRVPIFGVFVTCELGNQTERNPDGWNTRLPHSSRGHMLSSGVCCFATLQDEGDPWSAPSPQHAAGESSLDTEGKPAAPPLLQHLLQSFSMPWCCQQACRVSEKEVESVAAVKKALATPVSVQVLDPEAGKEYMKVLRGISAERCGTMEEASIRFWIPGFTSDMDMYRMSKPVTRVDVFISQVIRPYEGATPGQFGAMKAMMACVGIRQIAARLAGNNNVDDVELAMANLQVWVDRACVDQTSKEETLRIIKNHLEDFLHSARYVLCLLSPNYFTRLWCIFELCCALAFREDLGTMIFTSLMVPLFEASALASSIENLSVSNATCFDPVDRSIIEEKITEEFYSVPDFERLAQAAALGFLARDTLAQLVEYRAISVWARFTAAAGACGFTRLQEAMQAVDIAAEHEAMRRRVPDTPEHQAATRCDIIATDYAAKWFQENAAPLIVELRARSLRTRVRSKN